MIFSTTMAAVSVSGLLASGAFLPGPAWVSDYGTAAKQAADQGKPMAVFIAQGGEGYAHVVSDAPVPADAARLLKDKYVCLFVDTATADGKATAAVFAMQQGLVISSKGGKQQAVRHDGTVSPTGLTQYLTKYADAGETVVTTESNTVQVVVPAAAVAQPGVVQPAAYPYNPYVPSSCPSCRQRAGY